jgi:acyl carrier protein
MTETQQVIFNIIANILGVEAADITLESDFLLDFNATPADMKDIKSSIETTLDITLPEFDEEPPITIGDLMELVEDSLL